LAKLKQKKIAEFEHNVTNMLIHLYNGKQCQDYIKEYKTIVDNVILLIFFMINFVACLDEKEFWPSFK
jgi:hypothetical protein